jgi:hypothetical protein
VIANPDRRFRNEAVIAFWVAEIFRMASTATNEVAVLWQKREIETALNKHSA